MPGFACWWETFLVITMITQTMTLQDLQQRPLEELLRSIVALRQVVFVTLPTGAEVMIQPKPQLPPLPELDGAVPATWKEAIYAEQ